ncbi:homeobox protein goosecoid-like [Polyodon spathula]|uniref:homeobox protein goosecoid-like n=1 Tax=Polyodon spathula TaxID=7913 RepID=UPI001B7E2ADC|nr:homeobox protein goosecoid-like [Polyodon spathula]
MQITETYPFSIDNILGSTSNCKGYACNSVTAPVYPNAAWEHLVYPQPGCSGYPGYYSPAPAPLVPLHHAAVYSPAYRYPGYAGYAAGCGPFSYPQITDLGVVQQDNLDPEAAPAVSLVSSSELRYLSQIISCRKRHRARTVFTGRQTEEMELLFGRTDYPAPAERDRLARRVGLSVETIRVWFKNRRARRKRQGLRPKSRNIAHKTAEESDDEASEPGKELTV